MPFPTIIIAAVFLTVFVFAILYICHKRRALKENRRRKRRQLQKASEGASKQRVYVPHFSSHEVNVQPLQQVYIHPNPSRRQKQQQPENGVPFINPSESNHSLHSPNSPNGNLDDIQRVAANLLNGTSEQQQQQQQKQQQQNSPPSPQQQRTITPRTSPHLELSTLPILYHQQASSRRNPDRNNNMHPSPSFSPMQLQQEATTTLPSGGSHRGGVDGAGDDSNNGVRRVDSHSYRVRPSPLPRPLHLRRPIVTDTSITPSSKVVTTIGRGAPVVVQDDDSNSPIEPPVVIIGKSPVLMAMGINMLSHSPSSASAASQRATPPAKSTARKVSIRRQATATTLAGSQTQAASTQAQTQTQTQTQQTPQQQVTQIRNGYAEEESEEELENPFMSKEEFQRQAPQAILPKDFKHAQFTVPLPSLPNTNMVENDSSDDEEGDLNTGRLVLEPYLTPAELAAFLVPAVAPKHVQEELSTSSSVSTGQSTNTAPTPSAPARPPRRVPDAADQPNQSQSQIQGQRQQRHDGQGHAQAQPPQNIHSLAPSPEVPWSLPSDGSLGLSSILATIPGQQPPASPPSPAPPSPSPSPTPSLSSTKSSTSSMRTRPPPPTLPPPRGSRSSSASQSGSERAMSPAPSLSYSSSNISTGLSIISSQPDTIVTDVSSFVSLGDTPTTTASMMCASPTFQPVLSPTSPATPATARSFSVSTAASPVSSRRPPGRSPPITAESGDDYGWSEQDNNNTGNTDDDKTVVGQAKKKRVPQAIGGGTRLSRFNFDI